MGFRSCSGAGARGFLSLALAILAAAFATIGAACEADHRDMYFGTDAGAGFEAPSRETGADGTAGNGGTGGAAGGSSGAAGSGGGGGDNSAGGAGAGGSGAGTAGG